MPATPPDALLFITSGCPHCPLVLQGVSELVKEGVIGKLTVINATTHPELAAEQGVRAAPWLRLGPFTLTGMQSASALRAWAEKAAEAQGELDYLEHLFKEGELASAEAFIAQQPQRLGTLLEILSKPDEAITVRLGATALLEGYAGSDALQALLPQLGELSHHHDHRVRADACHLLGLTATPAARPFLSERLNDENGEVREIAEESLAELPTSQ